jgi:hypothetical protein
MYRVNFTIKMQIFTVTSLFLLELLSNLGLKNVIIIILFFQPLVAAEYAPWPTELDDLLNFPMSEVAKTREHVANRYRLPLIKMAYLCKQE